MHVSVLRVYKILFFDVFNYVVDEAACCAVKIKIFLDVIEKFPLAHTLTPNASASSTLV